MVFDLTEWREKFFGLFVMWHWFCGPLFWLTQWRGLI